MASSYYNKEKNKSYSGFAILENNKKINIGVGLAEGYTELLASRMHHNNKFIIYKKCKQLAEIFEYFFDNPKDMENYYFNHNLPGFIKYMEQFASREEIIKIIVEIDIINCDNLDITTTYYYTKIQLKLYNWFKEKNDNPDKLQKLENLICKNKIAAIVIKNEKIKLCKENPYNNEQDKQKTFRK